MSAPARRKALAVFVRDEAGEIVAGISGYTAWGWLYRAMALGRRTAARPAHGRPACWTRPRTKRVARGCHGAYIDTFNPMRAKTYQRQGYQPFGALDDFPNGRTRTFLQKKLAGLRRRGVRRASAAARRSSWES